MKWGKNKKLKIFDFLEQYLSFPTVREIPKITLRNFARIRRIPHFKVIYTERFFLKKNLSRYCLLT